MFGFEISYIAIKQGKLILTPGETLTINSSPLKYTFEENKTIRLDVLKNEASNTRNSIRLAQANINGNLMVVTADGDSSGRVTNLKVNFGSRYKNLEGVDMFKRSLTIYNDVNGKSHIGIKVRDASGNYKGVNNLNGKLILDSTGHAVQPTRMEISDRVGALQAALNAAGYTDNNGKKLVVDKKGGSITQAVAKKAGVDYRTWKVGDPIKPANPTQTTPSGTTPDVTTQTPSGTTPDVTTQTPSGTTPTYTAADYAKAGVAMNNAQNSLNQTREALFNKIDRIINQNGVKKGDKQAAEQIKQYVNAGDYRRALAAANYIYWPNRRKAVTDLLTQNMDAFDAHQSLSQQAIYKDINGEQPQQTMNERRTKKARMTEGKLVDMLTEKVLGENSKKHSNKSVMSESKLVDMITESMIKNGVITL